MTNNDSNWNRLESVIKWANMTVNYFARYIGLSRAENLYRIKRGDNGISRDLADRIVGVFPEIDRVWLLTGVGRMLLSDDDRGEQIPYYDDDLESALADIASKEPSHYVYMPTINGCDLAIRCSSRAMCEPSWAAMDVFLKKIESSQIIPGGEYALVTQNCVTLRKVRAANDTESLRLTARNRDDYDDMTIRRSEIAAAWRVVAKLVIIND